MKTILITILSGLLVLSLGSSAGVSSPPLPEQGESSSYTVFLPMILSPTNALSNLNAYRALADLPPVMENSLWSEGDRLHARYVVKNDVLVHAEDPANPWYTLDGDAAGQSSNVLAEIGIQLTDSQAVDKWMSGPFHAVNVLDPRLQSIGFGSYREFDHAFQTAAALDTFRGLGDVPDRVQYPVFYPAQGKALPVSHYSGGETPDPLSACPGYTAPSGPPVIVQFGTGFTPVNVTDHSFQQGATPLEHCLYTETSYTHPDPQQQALGRSFLSGRDALVIIPRQPLTPGASYTVSLIANGQSYTWSFSVAADAQGALPGQFIPPREPERIPTCTQTLQQATAANDWGTLSYSHHAGEGAWTLTGVTGRLREWQWDPYRGGPLFDLVEVYYQAQGASRPLWAALGVTLPAYYTVHDSASYDAYHRLGRGSQPYYVSFVEGAATRQEVLALFSRPGRQLVRLKAAGAHVSEQEINWERCEPLDSEYCTLARFFESLSPPMEDLGGTEPRFFQGESNLLIHTGSASSHPMYGFLIWPLRLIRNVSLCPQPNHKENFYAR